MTCRSTLTFLGTGTSMGVPTWGARARVQSRIRTTGACGLPCCCDGRSAGSERGVERVVVIDTGPDFREQALRDESDACGCGFLYPRARRSYSGHGRSAPAEFYRGARAVRFRSMPIGRRQRFWSRFRIHVLAGFHLSDARARATEAARRTEQCPWRGVYAHPADARRSCRSPDFALATRRI